MDSNSYFDTTADGYNRAYNKGDNLRSFIFERRKVIVLGLFDIKKGKILDIGCGPGVYTDRLSRSGYEIYGIDPSEKMVEIAKSKNFPNARFSVGRAEKIDFGDSFFDGILCVGVLEYLNSIEEGVRELSRVAKTGSVAVFTAPNASSILNIIDVALRYAVKALYKITRIGILKNAMDHAYDLRLVKPREIDMLLKKYGFDIEDRVFHIFRISFLNRISPGLSLWLAKKMDFIKNPFLGIDYIVKCRKK